jgi:hypothetical protein
LAPAIDCWLLPQSMFRWRGQAMIVRFHRDNWEGNRWPCIDIDPADAQLFLPLLSYLSAHYGIPMPRIIDCIDGYATDFALLGAQATLQIDPWTFSLACEQAAVRERVLADLQALPADFFSAL